ncbi:MAG: DUF2946 family protein [Rhodoferax sp.]|nr:DUF2946 family protein [Rhodoferax sp.]
MDDIVKQALVKWPNVPHCYGWLGLDARGNWYMRDDRTQALGTFADGTLQSKGSLLKHEKLIDFIQRNYETDSIGQWFFQNGPQRVYVELEAAPFVWRVDDEFSVTAHTGEKARVQRCVVDDAGRVYLETDLGFGLVHTQDMLGAANAIEAGLWVPVQIPAKELPDRFAFVKSPQALKGPQP